MRRIGLPSSLLSALFLVALLSLSSFLLMPTANGQTTATETTTIGDKIIPPSNSVTTYVNDTGLTINYVPPGWTAIDHNTTSQETTVSTSTATTVRELGSTPVQYGGTGGSGGIASPEELQECEQLGIPRENCSDVTILAKKRLIAAQENSQNPRNLDSAQGDLVAELCPPGSTAVEKYLVAEGETYTCDPPFGSILIRQHNNLQDSSFVYAVTDRDPTTGLFVLNVTAEDILAYTKEPSDLGVQNKSVYVNITYFDNGTSWKVPGLIALITEVPDYHFNYLGLYFVDYTTGYSLKVYGPRETESEGMTTSNIPDLRGDPIPIHGIGLDNLPAVMDEPMKIINSVSITRR